MPSGFFSSSSKRSDALLQLSDKGWSSLFSRGGASSASSPRSPRPGSGGTAGPRATAESAQGSASRPTPVPLPLKSASKDKPRPRWPPDEWFDPPAAWPPPSVSTSAPPASAISMSQSESGNAKGILGGPMVEAPEEGLGSDVDPLSTPALSVGWSRESTWDSGMPEAMSPPAQADDSRVEGEEGDGAPTPKRRSSDLEGTLRTADRLTEEEQLLIALEDALGPTQAQTGRKRILQVVKEDGHAEEAFDPDHIRVLDSPPNTLSLTAEPTRPSRRVPHFPPAELPVFDSPSSTQSLAPIPGDDDVLSDSPSATQSLAVRPQPSPRSSSRSLTRPVDADDGAMYINDSPSNTQSIAPAPPNHGCSSLEFNRPIFASPASTLILDVNTIIESPSSSFAGSFPRPTPPLPLRPLGSVSTAKSLSPRPPSRPPVFPFRPGTGGGLAPPPTHPQRQNSISTVSTGSTSSASSEASSLGNDLSDLKKKLPPPQHPSIVMREKGWKGPEVKETLDAVEGKYGNGSRMVNQYIFGHELGRGSFGAVQLATDAETGRDYGVKVFSKARLRRKMQVQIRKGRRSNSKEEDEGADALFLIRNEVAIMKKVHHPNVVALHEVLDVEGEDSLYMVMEYCRGGSLMHVGESAAEAAGAAMDEDTARKYFRQIVLGIDYLHQNEIIHHDIKPDNILLTSDRKTCKIADFGVSAMFQKPGDDTSTRAMGSPAFSSPELCGGLKPGEYVSGTAADIWAVGVTLYCMVKGTLPFAKGGQLIEMYEAIRTEQLFMPDTWSPDLCDLLLHLLDKDQDTRIKMPELREHPWVTLKGRRPLPSASENSRPVGPITETDVRHVFRHAVSNSFAGFWEVIEAAMAHSRKFGETHERGRRREFFKEFYRQVSVRAVSEDGWHPGFRPQARPTHTGLSTGKSAARTENNKK